jgi:hypothetical protein
MLMVVKAVLIQLAVYGVVMSVTATQAVVEEDPSLTPTCPATSQVVMVVVMV